MEYLVSLFSQLSGNGQHLDWVFLITIGIAAALFALGVLVVMNASVDPVKRRLHRISGHDDDGGGASSLARTLAPLGVLLQPRRDWERSHIRSRLVHAGLHGTNAYGTFLAIKGLLFIALPILVLFAATLYPRFSTVQVAVLAIAAALIGSVLPNMYLAHRVETRKRKLMNGFPDALDLLVACSEAGLGLNAAMEQVASEIAISHPELAEELALVNAEIRAGVERTDALHDLAERTGLDDIRGLVSLLTQSLRFGSSIADALRIYAEEFRDKRMQQAEEVAAKIGTKMIMPLVLCLFPAFFLVAVGPAILSVIRVFQL